MAITDEIYLRDHRQIVSQLDTNIPKCVFSGATLEIPYSGEGPAKVDDATRDRLLDFAQDFLDCGDSGGIHTGYPERQFTGYLLELRAQGLGPDVIMDVISGDYMAYVYPGGVLSFLNDSVRMFGSVEAPADVEGDREMRDEVRQAKRDPVGPR